MSQMFVLVLGIVDLFTVTALKNYQNLALFLFDNHSISQDKGVGIIQFLY
jgi:hypothetical protein